METYISESGNASASWLNYIKFMRFFDDIKFVRTLCKRGLEYCDEYETLGEAWLEWEKKFGTIESMLECESKVKKKTLKMQALKQQQQRSEDEIDDAGRGNKGIKRKRVEGREQEEEQKTVKGANKPLPLSQRHTLFVKSIPAEVLDDELEQYFSKVNQISEAGIKAI